MDPDLPVMRALQGGDDAALNELMARHREPLHRFVCRYLQDETAAADVVQETFVRVYFKASRYDPRSSVKTWIYTIALNLCRDQFRRRKSRPVHVPLSPPGVAVETAIPNEPPDPTPHPALQAAQSDRIAMLREAIDRLPDKLKAPLVLFSLEGHSQIEAADILGTTPKTVELRVYRAKEKLRAVLRGWLGREE